ncbi:HET-domain-containing protein [Coniochaeta ligniaria NRRL 30616]|uniref:HET-domain-containing protein n=1 Tax=Coniochaeta ligniaria NRRL 30616 TaxID=1408157 RepID=A0A1J7JAM2_9PEZI|nr:HET-domain-containing protein [Coniochaeta ligniaria NRRL 30616]
MAHASPSAAPAGGADKELQPEPEPAPGSLSAAQLYSNLPFPAATPSIRVLDLAASEPAENGEPPLKGTLRVISLQDAVRFDTLSYLWGDPSTGKHTIQCAVRDSGACALAVAANCQAALEAVRKRFGAVTIWVDAICINQADDAEKESQIPLMGEIYAGGRLLYVWLGAGTDTTAAAVVHIRLVAATGTRLPLDYLAARDGDERVRELAIFEQRAWADVRARLQVLFFSSGRHFRLKDMAGDVFNRQWIRRAWTFQEILLATRPIILCGDSLLLWEDLVSAVAREPGDSSLTRTRTSVTSVAHWKSLVDLWLDLRRPGLDTPDDDDDDGPGGLEAAQQHRHGASFRERLKRMRITRSPLAVVFQWMSCLSASATSIPETRDWEAAGTPRRTYAGVFTRPQFHRLGVMWLPARLRVLDTGVRLLATLIWVGTVSVVVYKTVGWVGQLRHWADMTDQELTDVVLSLIFAWIFGGWVFRARSPQSVEVDALVNGVRSALVERQATNPVDTVLSLYGILKSYGLTPSLVNYQKTVPATFLGLFQDLLAWKPEAIILLVDAGRAMEGSPSWLPDWTRPPPSRWLTADLVLESASLAEISRVGPPPASIRGSILAVKGLYQGTFHGGVYPGVPETWDLYFLRLLHLVFRSRVLKARHGRADTLGKDCDTLYFALLGRVESEEERDEDAEASSYEFRCAFQDAFEPILRDYTHFDGDNNPADLTQKFQARRFEYEIRKPTLQVLFDEVQRKGRCLFVLSSGLIGTGPRMMRSGDEVFAIRGVPALMVLRREGVEAGYKVVGAALIPSVNCRAVSYDEACDLELI